MNKKSNNKNKNELLIDSLRKEIINLKKIIVKMQNMNKKEKKSRRRNISD